jgi:hypothetical protein
VFNWIVAPGQYGPVLNAEAVAVVTTTVVEFTPVHPLRVTVRLYTPAFAMVTFVIVGFWTAEVNPGPDQEYVPPPPPDKTRFEPTHTGPLLVAVTVGCGLITTIDVAVLVQIPEVIVCMTV